MRNAAVVNHATLARWQAELRNAADNLQFRDAKLDALRVLQRVAEEMDGIMAPEAPPLVDAALIPSDLLGDLEEFLDDRADVVDGASGPRPNSAMSLRTRVDAEVRR